MSISLKKTIIVFPKKRIWTVCMNESNELNDDPGPDLLSVLANLNNVWTYVIYYQFINR